MAWGVANHVWSIDELIEAVLEPSGMPPLPRPTQPTTFRLGCAASQREIVAGLML